MFTVFTQMAFPVSYPNCCLPVPSLAILYFLFVTMEQYSMQQSTQFHHRLIRWQQWQLLFLFDFCTLMSCRYLNHLVHWWSVTSTCARHIYSLKYKIFTFILFLQLLPFAFDSFSLGLASFFNLDFAFNLWLFCSGCHHPIKTPAVQPWSSGGCIMPDVAPWGGKCFVWAHAHELLVTGSDRHLQRVAHSTSLVLCLGVGWRLL